jgi:hypothetical protein
MNNCRAILNKRNVNDTFNDTNVLISKSREAKTRLVKRGYLNLAISNKMAVKKHKTSILIK